MMIYATTIVLVLVITHLPQIQMRRVCTDTNSPMCLNFETANTSCQSTTKCPKGSWSKTGIVIAQSGKTGVQYGIPYDAAVDSSNNIYVANAYFGNVIKLAPTSDPKIYTWSKVAGGVGNPWGVFVVAGSVYVSSTLNNNVLKFIKGSDVSSGGVPVAGNNGNGPAQNQLRAPNGIFVDCAQNIYIADSQNNRIQRWAKGATTGCTVAGDSSGKAGSSATLLNAPIDVRIDKHGNMFVLDAGNNRIQKFAPGFRYGVTVGTNLNGPIAMFVDDCDNVYITEFDAQTVVRFSPGSRTPTVIIPQINQAKGITMDGQNNLFVASASDGLLKYSYISSTRVG